MSALLWCDSDSANRGGGGEYRPAREDQVPPAKVTINLAVAAGAFLISVLKLMVSPGWMLDRSIEKVQSISSFPDTSCSGISSGGTEISFSVLLKISP